MTRWEYRGVATAEGAPPEQGLNALGAEGWECFAVAWVGDMLTCWLKRPLED